MTDEVTVTQADVVAAIEIGDALGSYYKSGFGDHREKAKQIAAAHRIASTAALAAENARLREVSVIVTSSLAAAISLLERGGKVAAASDRMFDQMVDDYRKSLERARQVLKGE